MARITVDGKPLEVPEDFTLGELLTLKRRFGVDIVASSGDTSKLATLEGMAGIAHLTIARAYPGLTADQVDAKVDALSMSDMVSALDDEPDPQVPAERPEVQRSAPDDAPSDGVNGSSLATTPGNYGAQI